MERTNHDSGETVVILGEGIDPKLIRSLKHARMVVTYELSTEFQAKEYGIPAIYFHRFAQSEKIWDSFMKVAQNWIDKFPKEVIYHGNTILDILKFEDTSLWWFNNYTIWERKNGIIETVYTIKTLSSILDLFNPKTIEIIGIFDFEIIKMLNALSKKYKFKLKQKNVTIKHVSKLHTKPIKRQLNMILNILYSKVITQLSIRKKKTHLIFVRHGHVTIRKNIAGSDLLLDNSLDGLEDYLMKNRNKIKFVSLNTPQLHSSKTKNFFSNLANVVKGNYTPWVSYYSFFDLFHVMKLHKRYKHVMQNLEQDPDFIKSMMIEGINIYQFIKSVFQNTIVNEMPFIFLQIQTARKIIEKEKPETVFTSDSLSPWCRAITFACNTHKIENTSPQIGVMSPYTLFNSGFLFTKDFDKRLLPIYLVWGSFYQRILVIMGYPKLLTKIVGFWRLDENQRKQENSSEYLLYIAGSNPGYSSYIMSFDEEILTIKKIHENLPKEMKLMVKLHPSHSYDDFSKALCGLERIILEGGPIAIDINKAIINSKFVIGKASSAIIQALILKKPAMLVNLVSELNFLGLKDIPFATTVEDLSKNMELMLSKKFIKNFELNDYCYPLGRESISLITDLLSKKQNFKS